jgi:hypothetical protein
LTSLSSSKPEHELGENAVHKLMAQAGLQLVFSLLKNCSVSDSPSNIQLVIDTLSTAKERFFDAFILEKTSNFRISKNTFLLSSLISKKQIEKPKKVLFANFTSIIIIANVLAWIAWR